MRTFVIALLLASVSSMRLIAPPDGKPQVQALRDATDPAVIAAEAKNKTKDGAAKTEPLAEPAKAINK